MRELLSNFPKTKLKCFRVLHPLPAFLSAVSGSEEEEESGGVSQSSDFRRKNTEKLGKFLQ